MESARRVGLLAILVLGLMGCVMAPVVPSAPPTLSPYPTAIQVVTGGDAAANATAQKRAAEDAAATFEVVTARETATSAAATRMVVSATEQAQAVIQATTGAATATAEGQSVRATDMALSIGATSTAVQFNFESTLQAVQIQATTTAEERKASNDALLAQDEANRLAQLRQAEAIALQRAQFWADALPVIVLVLVIGVIGTLSVIIASFIRKMRVEPIQIIEANGRDVPVLLNDGQWQVVPQPRLPAPPEPLTLPATIDHDEVQDTAVDDVPPANWDSFMRWQDDLRIPIGADINNRQPILVNRAQKPHLLIAGTTGTGKTKTGIIPYVAGNLGAGLQVLLMNGRGADFLSLEQHPNVTSLRISRAELPLRLMTLLESMVMEMDRRDDVLYRYGVGDWSDLPPYAGESPEILVVIDEFLAIISGADDLPKEEELRMWKALIRITSEARKFGMYVALTMTDPTARNLGKEGMTVRSQMARMVLAMGEEAASRAILGNARDFPYGTMGLPLGQFVATVGGRAQHGVGFHPSPAEVQAYFNSRPVVEKELPDLLLDVGERPLLANSNGAATTPISQAEVDGLRLGSALNEPHMNSFRAIGRFLLDKEMGKSVSGQEIDTYVKPALDWRVRELNCQKSQLLLRRCKV